MNDMVLNSDEVASKHVRISRIGGRWQIQNLSLQEFTMLNGRRIEQRTLRDGDEITIGDAVCRFLLVRNVSNSKNSNKKENVIKTG
jgi:pSer/pThr/pTyr-binding forkhead associated (FHA) protein